MDTKELESLKKLLLKMQAQLEANAWQTNALAAAFSISTIHHPNRSAVEAGLTQLLTKTQLKQEFRSEIQRLLREVQQAG